MCVNKEVEAWRENMHYAFDPFIVGTERKCRFRGRRVWVVFGHTHTHTNTLDAAQMMMEHIYVEYLYVLVRPLCLKFGRSLWTHRLPISMTRNDPCLCIVASFSNNFRTTRRRTPSHYSHRKH